MNVIVAGLIGLAVGVIGTLVGGLIYLYKAFRGFSW